MAHPKKDGPVCYSTNIEYLGNHWVCHDCNWQTAPLVFKPPPLVSVNPNENISVDYGDDDQDIQLEACMPYFDVQAYDRLSTPGNPYYMATIKLDREPSIGDVLKLPFAGKVRVARILPKEESIRDCPTLFLTRIEPKMVKQAVFLKEIQKALLTLISRQSRGEMTHQQFFEAMEAWERCFRNEPEGDYNTEILLGLATSHCL